MKISIFSRLPFAPLFALVALAVTVAVYSPGLQGGYALDDYTNIVDNEALALKQLDWADLSRAAFSFQAGPTMRPISMVSFALNRYFYGPDVYSFKLTNLIIHLLNGVLVFLFLAQLFASYRRRYAPQMDDKRLQWTGLLVGAMWLLHPLNFLPVMYVVQRETRLSALFVLLGVNLYLWARERQLAGKASAPYIWVGVPLATLLATLCKESGALLPLYLLTLELFILRFRDAAGGFSRATAAFYLVFLFLPGLAGLALMITARGGAYLNYGNRDFTLLERLMSEARVV
ncbi:MAG TPA: tetratricopeptide repeat protein, partial [Gammaproteobacteria bacterium]|nr:tetratricopeptide repeat protein [Gammaproteobacteria bacterium]